MADPREAAYTCEAKKISYRQTRDGIVVSYVIHPNDVPARMATSPLGTRVMLAVAEIGDDERPVAHAEPVAAPLDPAPSAVAEITPPHRKGALRRAGMLPNDLAFQRWIQGYPPGRRCPVDDWEPADRKLHAEVALRQRLGVKSRSELAHSDDLCAEFDRLVAGYDVACGRRAA